MPAGFTVFYTTIDFDGRIDERIRDFVHPAELASCHQVHGVGACRAAAPGGHNRARPRPYSEPTCDALWTDQRRVALAIKVADCLPVSVIDSSKSVLANIHCGWRGAVQGVVPATLDLVPLDPASSSAFLGPSIRVCCFEVGGEVAEQFDDRFVDRSGSKPHVDLTALTIDILLSRGFHRENIIDTQLCTRCDAGVAGLLGDSVAERPSNVKIQQPLFHSFRRDKRSGRNLAIVAS